MNPPRLIEEKFGCTQLTPFDILQRTQINGRHNLAKAPSYNTANVTMGFTDFVNDAAFTSRHFTFHRPTSWLLTHCSARQLGQDSQLCRRVSRAYSPRIPSALMRRIWSVLMRRLKTPSNEYFQCARRTTDTAARQLHMSTMFLLLYPILT